MVLVSMYIKLKNLTRFQFIEFMMQVDTTIYIVRGGEAELNQYLPWTQYEGIEGYVYSPYQTPPAGTIPVYAFFAEESLNCILITDEKEIPSYSEWCIYNGILFYAYPV